MISQFKFSLSNFCPMQKLEDSFDGSFPDNIRSTAYKSQFANKKNKLVINVSDTQYAVVKHVAKKNKWYLQTQPFSALTFDVCWTDNHVKPELFARMQTHQKINHFPGMAILSRKNNLGTNLMHFRKKFPGEYDFFPITWSLPNDYCELMAYNECRQQGKAQTFIIKPEASCQGRGIYMTRNIEKIRSDRCVVQRYMHKPYLIEGLKFDLRIYVLVAGVDPLRIYVYEEGLARFATEPYQPPRSDNLDNKYMHLTNYAINKDNPKFIFNQSVTSKLWVVADMDIGHKRSLTSVYKRIADQGHDVSILKKKIADIFIKTIITGYPTLSQSLTSVHPYNFANDMCFQILGFDVMIDSKLNPCLIQINYTPSFTADTPLDRHIKKSLIEDTLVLLGVNEKWKREGKVKRDREVQERMLSGKRKKYSIEERKTFIFEQAKRRNQYQLANLGRFTKIFILDEQQLNQHKKYYDYAMQVYNFTPKLQNHLQLNKQTKQFVPYHHYFQNGYELRKEKENIKNNSKIIRKSKENDANGSVSRSGQQISFISASVNKRISSAKSRKEKKQRKVVYDRVSSKKSLRNIEDTRNNKQMQTIDNSSIFQNKNLQQIILKQRQSEQQYQNDDNPSQYFN